MQGCKLYYIYCITQGIKSNTLENSIAEYEISIDSLIEKFIRYCKFEKNLSAKTIKFYQIDLRQWLDFIDKNHYSKTITHIDKEILREYMYFISHLQPKSIKRKMATIKAFYNYLEYEDTILINPFRKLKIQIKESKTLPKVMNIHEVEKIIKQSYKLKENEIHIQSYAYGEKIRNIAVIELLFATGVRVSELSNLKEDCIDIINGHIRVQGKGNKERIIQVSNKDTLISVRNYFNIYKSKIKECGYFFINRLNRRLSEQSIRFLVSAYAKDAGIERRITPHVFRHSFATLLLEENVDIKYIQQLLGHSSILTTQIYTHVSRSHQRKILKSHPRRKIKIH
jgi:integrase/recombinase XerD